MEKQKIINWLKEFNQEDVEKYASYLLKLSEDSKNFWIKNYSDEKLINLFKQVSRDWLVFDWINITLQSTWISYNYVALKNKMLLVYPESIIDINLVYKWDDFNFSKQDWKVIYSHKISNPFWQKDEDIIWAYTIIKNKRWEFITLLSQEDILKHRKTAKTDLIWKLWFKEMSLKTIMKKACKLHFWDIFTNIEEIDNENNDLENPLDIDLKFKSEIDSINTLEWLLKYYQENKWKWKELDIYLTKRKKQIIENNNK